MALETASYIANLVQSNPDGGDQRSTADDHIRLIKAALKRSFPLINGAVSLSHTQLMRLNDVSASVQFQLNTLRDGSATAQNAIFANSASFARHAGTLLGPGGELSFSAFRQIDDVSFSNSIHIRGTSARIRFVETNASASCSNAGILLDGNTFAMRFYDSDWSANNAVVFAVRPADGSVFAERAGINAAAISLSAATVFINGGLNVGGTNVTNAGLFTSGTLTVAVVPAAAVTQYASQLSVSAATVANFARSASDTVRVAGVTSNASATANTVVVRNGSGDVFARYFNMSGSASYSAAVTEFIVGNGDGFFQRATPAHAGANIAAQNITGRSGTAKNLASGSGPPSLTGSTNGDLWYYY